jgi:hypothetical protein
MYINDNDEIQPHPRTQYHANTHTFTHARTRAVKYFMELTNVYKTSTIIIKIHAPHTLWQVQPLQYVGCMSCSYLYLVFPNIVMIRIDHDSIGDRVLAGTSH